MIAPRSNAPEVEPVVVERGSRLGIGEGQHLEAVVEQEPVDDVGPDPSSDRVGALEHERSAPARDERAGAGEAGHSRADDDDVVFFAHACERTAASSGDRVRPLHRPRVATPVVPRT